MLLTERSQIEQKLFKSERFCFRKEEQLKTSINAISGLLYPKGNYCSSRYKKNFHERDNAGNRPKVRSPTMTLTSESRGTRYDLSQLCGNRCLTSPGVTNYRDVSVLFRERIKNHRYVSVLRGREQGTCYR